MKWAEIWHFQLSWIKFPLLYYFFQVLGFKCSVQMWGSCCDGRLRYWKVCAPGQAGAELAVPVSPLGWSVPNPRVLQQSGSFSSSSALGVSLGGSLGFIPAMPLLCGWAGTSAPQGIPAQDTGSALLLTLGHSEQAASFSLHLII